MMGARPRRRDRTPAGSIANLPMLKTAVQRAAQSEWAWALAVSLMALALANVPYVAGYLAQSGEWRFAWVAPIAEDNLSYIAKIGQGLRGSWLFHLPYTAQAHAGAPVYLYYLLLGHLARWLGLPAVAIYHLARVANGLALLLVAYAFIQQVVESPEERRALFGWVAFSSGLGWLMLAFGYIFSADVVMPESNTFFTLMDTAHFPLAQALMLGAFLSYLRVEAASGRGRWGAAALGALALAALAVVQPFAVATVLGAAGCYGLARIWRDRRWPRALIAGVALSALAALPILGFTWVSLNADPALRAWQQQNLTPSPLIWDYLTGYGLIAIFAAPGAVWAWRRRSDVDLLMLSWVAATVLAVYSPTTLQRRLVIGLHLPLACLAGLGVYQAWQPRLRGAARRLLPRLAWLATWPTSVALVLLFTAGALAHHPKMFVSADEAEALEWLSRNAPADGVVLSSTALGMFIPAMTPQRAVSGHTTETLDVKATEAKVSAFYDPATSAAERKAALAEWQPDFVLLGPRERVEGLNSLDGVAGLRWVAAFGEVSLYAVRSP